MTHLALAFVAVLCAGSAWAQQSKEIIMQNSQWKQIKPGVIALGQQTIVFDELDDRFVWREGDRERGRYRYLNDAKRTVEDRQRELEEIGVSSPDQR